MNITKMHCSCVQPCSKVDHSCTLALPTQRRAADLPTTPDCPMALFPINTLQQEVNVCLLLKKRTSLAITEAPGSPFADLCKHRSSYSTLDLSTRHQVAWKKHHGNSAGEHTQGRHISKTLTS